MASRFKQGMNTQGLSTVARGPNVKTNNFLRSPQIANSKEFNSTTKKGKAAAIEVDYEDMKEGYESDDAGIDPNLEMEKG
jgi:hypothetical protein